MSTMTRALMVGIGLVAGATIGAGPALAALSCGPCDHGNAGWHAGGDCADGIGAPGCLDNGDRFPIVGPGAVHGDCPGAALNGPGPGFDNGYGGGGY